ncbi:MAG: dephospho-CoA kinase [Candidatus Marinimicrobia bacterium]|nr:dephospho-CoA kinase [Candidatus Neomarinimicrobiota bacterium]
MQIWGVTGGLGSGKSTACSFFKEQGCEIFDADTEAKKIIFSSEMVRQKLVEGFGGQILEKGILSKTALANIIFDNFRNQQFLNHLIHPLVTEEFLTRRQAVKADVYIMDAALLFEARLQHYFHKTILIYTEKETRIKRALERGNLSRAQIEQRISLQMDEEQKKKLADIVIENNGTRQDLKNKINELMQILV